ncbi:MAG: hypothetical protein K2J16_02150 [Clostridia bacterium]|nr:hypothetical protein [Clostridia bacterium]
MSENKHCYSCKFYKPYYTKGYKQFDRCDIGLCTKKKATVEKQEVCNLYSSMYIGRIDRKQAALSAVTDHINLLSELKQILEEDDDEAIQELFFDFKRRKK